MSETVLGPLLDRFRAIDSVEMAAVVSPDGLVIDVVADPDIDINAICAVGSSGLAMAETLGSEIDKGQALQTMLEYEQGLVVLEPINSEAMLLVMARMPEDLGSLRFLIALHRYELLEALETI
jgi:hypothetical protein